MLDYYIHENIANIMINYQFVIMRNFLLYQLKNNLENHKFHISFNLLIEPQKRALS
jgi:hypothetical protein